jgi:hypothetical protein
MSIAFLLLACVSACAEAAPGASVAAPAGDAKTVCAMVTAAGQSAKGSLAPVAAALAGSSVSEGDIAKATDDLKAAFTAMHLGVAAAAEVASDADLKTKISAYQYSIEQAIVVVEGADGRRDRLADAIELPAVRDAEQAVMEACDGAAWSGEDGRPSRDEGVA